MRWAGAIVGVEIRIWARAEQPISGGLVVVTHAFGVGRYDLRTDIQRVRSGLVRLALGVPVPDTGRFGNMRRHADCHDQRD